LETYFYNGLTKEDFLNEDNWETSVGKYIDSPEYIQVTLDKDDKVLEGIQSDGTKVIGGDINVGGSANISGDIRVLGNMELSVVSYKVIENPEWIKAIVDSQDKIICGIKVDGTFSVPAGIDGLDDKLQEVITQMQQMLEEAEDDIDAKLEVFNSIFSIIEDPEERSEITTDTENKIISYRDSDGVKHEEVGIETNHLELSPKGMTEFQQALKDSGFTSGQGDWSDEKIIYIPIPYNTLPIVNLTLEELPKTKTDELTGIMQYWDKNGNYFKKNIEGIGIQGQTTSNFPKKNYKFDFSDCEIKFGNWPLQDGFHLKANYTDIVRGKSNLAYDYFLDIVSYNRGVLATKPWLNTLLKKTTYLGAEGSNDFDFAIDAKGVPQGFAFSLYINEEYWGVYTWNLKKDKGNYAMKKSKAKQIHIDPDHMGCITGGEILWDAMEIRNPKGLKDIDGNKYDGDNPKELSDTDPFSKEVKDYINEFATNCQSLWRDYLDDESKKTLFEKVFDLDWIIDFTIFQNVILDRDGNGRNTQYCTWDGKKWFTMPYDLDQIFGNWALGTYITNTPSENIQSVCGLNLVTTLSCYGKCVFGLYKDKMDARYKELRDGGIISVSYLMGIIKKYTANIGVDEFKKEFERWPEAPCRRSNLTNPQWEFIQYNDTGNEPTRYDDNTQYQVDDVVKYYCGPHPFFENTLYKCIESCKGVTPTTGYYENWPNEGGFFDSILRMEMWLKERINFIDTIFNYNV